MHSRLARLLRTGAFLAFLCVTGAISGCGGGPELFALKGKVTHKGKPVPLGEIIFSPDTSKGSTGPQAVAEIKNGEYATSPNQGVVGGPYKIRVVGYDGVPTKANGEELPKGKSLFYPYEGSVDLPKENNATHDITVPENTEPKPSTPRFQGDDP